MGAALPQLEPRASGETLRREFTFPGHLAALAAARDSIMDFVHRHCDSEQWETDILIALQEGLANAVLHGCGSDPAKLVHCSVEITPEAITIVIRDPGKGFDTAAVCADGDAGANFSDHGRGLLMMRGLMDEVTFRSGGSEVEMKKLRTLGSYQGTTPSRAEKR